MVAVLADLHHAGSVARTLGTAGGPWEFNLRDLLRWCQLAEGAARPVAGLSEAGAAQVGFPSHLLACMDDGSHGENRQV